MKNLILLVVIYGLLKNILIALAKSTPDSNMSEDINAILIKCPKNRANSSCEPHLIINIHMNPSVDVNNMEDSWILDEVYDPTRRMVSKIISPYLIVVSRGEPVVMYPLQYEKSIKNDELKGKVPTENGVKEVHGPPTSKTKEHSPSKNAKEHQDVKDVKGSASGKTNEPLNPSNVKDRQDVKDVQGSSSRKDNEPRPSINTKEDVKDVQGSSSPKDNEPRPSINTKEREDVKEVQGIPARKNTEPRPSMNMEEPEEVEDLQSSPPAKTDEPNPSINIEEHDEAEDLQGSPSRKSEEPSPSNNKEEQEEGTDLQGSKSDNTNDPLTPINMEDREDVKEVQGAPKPMANEPLIPVNIKELKEAQDFLRSLVNANEPSTNMKGQEINNSSRLKRNYGRLYTSQKALGLNNAFLQKNPLKDTTWNQNDISSLGLIQVIDSPLKRISDRLESPTELQRLNKKNSKYNNYKDKQKNALRSHQYYNRDPDVKGRNKFNQIESGLKESVRSWDKQILDMDWKEHNEGRDYQLKSERRPDSKKDRDFLLFDQMELGEGRGHNTEDMETYKLNYKNPESLFSYNKINENNNIKTIDSDPNVNEIFPKSKSLKFMPYEKKEHPNFKSLDNSLSSEKDFSLGRKRVQNNFKLPFNVRTNLNNVPQVRPKDRYDFEQPLDETNGYYKAKTAENSIHKEKNFPPGRDPEHINVRSGLKKVPSSEDSDEFYFNAPMNSLSGMNDIPYPIEYDQFNYNADAGGFSNRNDQLNPIVNHHLRENLQNIYTNKNDKQFDWANSHSLPYNFNPEDLSPDRGLSYSYSEFPERSRKKPFSKYPRNNPYRSVASPRSRDHKRIRRSNSPRQSVGNRFAQKYENEINANKLSNLQKMDENGEVPCDTCGGKNKKKDDKPPSRYCSALTEPKGPESKIEDFNAHEKLNDVIPCDTCGGKNKKPGGKSLPGGLHPEVHRVKAESVQPLTAEDMIPCERCKEHLQGNLASQSCGCVSNPSVCNCESSKSSRAAKNSEEDLTYSVFNMNNPVPFLTTQLRVFRRRHNTWWRVVPIVTLDSLSGIFANKNMSMVFTSRVGTFRQEKSSSFLNHKLVVPKRCANQVTKSWGLNALKELQNNIGKSFLVDRLSKEVSVREIKNFEEDSIKSIGSLGYFPKSMGALQKCPHKDKHLCLNIRGEKVPAFTIKVKIPFRENAFLIGNKHVVKISRIVTDATTKDALQISIDVINKGLEAQEFSIYVYNCPLSNSALSTASVKRLLLPNIGQTVNFLLPFISGSKRNRKFSCDVVVKDYDLKNSNKSYFMKSSDFKEGVIAKRPMDIKVLSRCFCIWRCRCHCMEKLETFINYNVCERMSRKSEEEAGLIYNCPPGNERKDICITDAANETQNETTCNLVCKIQRAIIFILLLLLALGVLKAFLGLCVQSIDQWGFDTVQPGRYYACTSRTRIFIVNLFFFIIFPFACWCKCFQPKPEDLMAASTDWSCNHERDDWESSSSAHKGSGKKSRLHGGQAQKLSENLLLAFAPHYENGLFKDDKPDDEESTAFILEVLEESKTSLSKMMSQTTHSSHSQETVSKCAENSEEDRAAEELVDGLKSSQRAYRMMSSPVGGVVDIPENCQYCVKGFFLPTVKGTYEFFSYHPLIQYIGISEENEVRKLPEPQYLHTDEFSRTYASKIEVFEAGDLSVVCPLNVPCINISSLNNLENSFVKLSALLEESPINDNETP